MVPWAASSRYVGAGKLNHFAHSSTYQYGVKRRFFLLEVRIWQCFCGCQRAHHRRSEETAISGKMLIFLKYFSDIYRVI